MKLQGQVYFCGAFTCEYRNSQSLLPFLQNNIDNLIPWATMAILHFLVQLFTKESFELIESQELWLDLGRGDDIACVKTDGEPCDILPWENLHLKSILAIEIFSKGYHDLEVTHWLSVAFCSLDFCSVKDQ